MGMRLQGLNETGIYFSQQQEDWTQSVQGDGTPPRDQSCSIFHSPKMTALLLGFSSVFQATRRGRGKEGKAKTKRGPTAFLEALLWLPRHP